MRSKNVYILNDAFYIPQLKRYRRIWLYLPEDYQTSKKSYPVLYMHDGQNLFDEATSFSGEWGVDEKLDSLSKTIGKCVVVGIDNGGDKRINEYTIQDSKEHGKAEGKSYLAFIVKTLKPFIDDHYRTKRSAKNTSITGSSLGGLISFYALLLYPKTFGSAGVFSPSFWISPSIKEEIKLLDKKFNNRMYFYAGKREGERMIKDTISVFESMGHYTQADMTLVINSKGKHDEASWGKAFPLFYHWLMQ